MTTVLETIDGGTRYLEKRGVEDARRNMQVLVAHALDCSRMDLYLRFDEPLPESVLAPLREQLKRRGEGTPLQHLTGRTGFLHHEFATDSRALIPRPETEELAELILKRLPESPRHLLDMGCGSGVLGLSLAAARPAWRVTLADVSPDALALARENAKGLQIHNAAFVESDLFQSLEGPFDAIVANLPYVPEAERPTLAREVLHDPAIALFGGPDGMELIRRFIPEAASRLAPGGCLALEIGHGQAAETSALLVQAGLADVEVLRDLSGIDRFPFASKPS